MLLPPTEAPAAGERFEQILSHRNLLVEQILSGRVEGTEPVVQDQDEWVVVLAGAAAVDVDGESVDLAAGDWVFLPSRVPHTVVRAEPGTSWLAVHLGPEPG